jgi:hypothetical protein
MKQTKATKKTLLIISFIAITLISIIGIGSVWARFPGTQQSDNANDQQALVRALRHGGLREAAKLKGHYVGDWDPNWDFSQLGVEALTKNSAAVIVGVATKKLGSRLAGEGKVILTDYEVSVQETIKGEVTPGGTITVSLIGGRVEFEDGTSAELRTPKFEHIKPGGLYTLFLSESQDGTSGRYTLTGGPQGLVELVDDNTVKSHGRPTDPITKESMEENSILRLVLVRARAEIVIHLS